jgi:hypothetical protein
MNSDPLRSGKASLLPVIQGARDQGWRSQDALRSLLERISRGDTAERARMGAVLSTATPREWITLDEVVRRTESPVARPRMPAAPDTVSLGLASMARDGHQREKATRELARQHHPLRAPFIALRTADWVPQVAEAARLTIDVLAEADPAAFAESVPVLIELSRRSRSQPLSRFEAGVAARPDAVRALLQSSDARTRRWGLDLALRVELLSSSELLSLARTDPDVGVETKAGLACLARLSLPTDRPMLDGLLRCGAVVRRQLLDALPIDDWSTAVAEGLLFDRSPLVRGGAQAVLLRAGRAVTPAYRVVQTEPRRRAIALFELGHVGDSSDVPAALAGLSDKDPGMRKAAIEAARRLMGDESLRHIVPRMHDRMPGVVRAAEQAMRSRARLIDPVALRAASRSPMRDVRGTAYRLLRARGLADRLEADLAAALDEDLWLREQGTADLVRWLRFGAASAPRPSAEALARLDKALETASHRLDRRMVMELRFHLGLRR